VLKKHLKPQEEKKEIIFRNPTSGSFDDDIVIVCAVRTPIGRAGKDPFQKLHQINF